MKVPIDLGTYGKVSNFSKYVLTEQTHLGKMQSGADSVTD